VGVSTTRWRSDRSELATNPDGSIDLVFAPQPPEDSPESNWLPTFPERAWFTYFRLYAPLQPYFDASWKLPDIEEAEDRQQRLRRSGRSGLRFSRRIARLNIRRH